MRPEMRPQMQSLQAALAIEDEEGVGCKAAVEIVSRNSQKGVFPSLATSGTFG